MLERRSLGIAAATAALFAPRVLRAQAVTEITTPHPHNPQSLSCVG